MAKSYQWRTDLEIVSGGYKGEPKGVDPDDTGWRTADFDDSGKAYGEVNATYWYCDSDSMSQVLYTNMAVVRVSVKDSWEITVDSNNVMRVKIDTVINSIERTSYGSPGANPRDISIYQYRGGPSVFVKNADSLTTHNISGQIVVAQRTITLQPGQDYMQSSLFYRSHSSGMPDTEIYTDEMNVGVMFKNPLPRITTFKLSYDANGGSGAPATQTWTGDASSHEFAVSSQQPTRKHWIFLGWSNNRKEGWKFPSDVEIRGGDKVTVSSPDRSDVTKTIYAVWEYTYRPGMILVGGTWRSCDRDADLEGGKYKTMLGKCHIRRNGEWVEMRTRKNQSGVDKSPVIRRNNAWPSQDILGTDASAHDVSY